MTDTSQRLYTIGAFAPWAASLVPDTPGTLSWRNSKFADLETWRAAARSRLVERLAQPDVGPSPPAVEVVRRYEHDGLHIEELRWQLPYGPPTEGVFLKPAGASGPLPAVLSLHQHGGNKWFGWRKQVQTDAPPHSLVAEMRERAYGGVAWANELAKRGYAVLAHDAFAFGSRRVRVADTLPAIADPSIDDDSDEAENVRAYNEWTGRHEAIMAKALFSAGTTWPGVFVAEDRAALDVLCARPEVDTARVGCCGLSGGGLRTVFLGGMDERIACAVCAGMMTTWRDYLLDKVHTHTWMCYVPLLPPEMDYPEILSLRVPKPTLVLNNNDDPLFTLPEMQRADRILAEVYEKAGASERYRASLYPGPHKFDLPMQAEAFAWFDQWLK